MKSLKLLRRDKSGAGLFLATRTITKAENTTDKFYRLTPEGFVDGDGSAPTFENHLPENRAEVISLLEADRIFKSLAESTPSLILAKVERTVLNRDAYLP
jgi:hypothetical protein